MNARDALIHELRPGLTQCQVCSMVMTNNGPFEHRPDCPVPAMLAQFDAMQKVCDAARNDLEKDNANSCARLGMAIAALDKLAELDKTKGEK